MSHDVKSREAVNSLGPPLRAGQWACRQRAGAWRPAVGRAQEDGGSCSPLHGLRQASSSLRHSAHPFGTWGRVGWVDFVPGVLPELGRGWRAGAILSSEARGPLPSPVPVSRKSRSAGTSGTPPPISKAGGPRSSLGPPGDMQGGRWGLRWEPRAPGHLAY